MEPLISGIIPAHNAARFLAATIESALAQTHPLAELVIVDDGSVDGTGAVIDRFAGRVRVIRQENQGVAAARNTGAARATGELLAFLDADDVWLPCKLERQVARFRAEAGLGLVHCGVETIDEEGKSLGRAVDGMEGSVAEEMLQFRRPVILGGGSGVMIRRDVFQEIGGFDSNLSTSADWDLYYRIARRWRVGFVPEPLLRYRLHGGNMHGNIIRMEHDMLFAYSKAFENPDDSLRRLRRSSYGNLHAVLAGSYFSAGQYPHFARHALKSLALTPGNIGHFLGYPVRRWRRRPAVPGGVSGSPTGGVER